MCSVFVRLDHGDRSFLLTGDAHDDSELSLLADPGMAEWLDVDVLKVGHHGSFTSSDVKFLDAVSPYCAVISSGDRKASATNRRYISASGRWRGYGHPRFQTVNKLTAVLKEAGKAIRARPAWVWNGATNKWISKRLRGPRHHGSRWHHRREVGRQAHNLRQRGVIGCAGPMLVAFSVPIFPTTLGSGA